MINGFFIVNGCLQSIPAISTNSPLASFIPVIWVIFMGMIFELITDLRRWRSDRQVNNQRVERVYVDRSTQEVVKEDTISADLQVGDIVVL